jgi:hypothetical protein
MSSDVPLGVSGVGNDEDSISNYGKIEIRKQCRMFFFFGHFNVESGLTSDSARYETRIKIFPLTYRRYMRTKFLR